MFISVFTVMPITAGAVTTDVNSISALSGDFEYEILDDGTAEITEYWGEDTELEIPGTLDGYTVTSIGGYAFFYRNGIKNIVIPDSVKTISDYAFFTCDSLNSITIPDSVTTLGENAFTQCSALKNVTIGKGVKSISEYAFSWCTSLESITIPDNVTSIGRYTFYRSGLTNITIPDSVKYIDSMAFVECPNLTSVTLGKGIVNIGKYAFGYSDYNYRTEEYEKINNFTISGYSYTGTESYSKAEQYARNNEFTFVSLGSIPPISTDSEDFNYEILEDGTTEIIRYYGEKTELEIPATLDGYTVTSIGKKAFFECENLRSVIIPNSVTNIGESAFAHCEFLSSVTLSDNIENIGVRAFYDCSAYLNNVTIGKNIVSIGPQAFGYYYEPDTDIGKTHITISGYSNTVAEWYAIENKIDFISLGEGPSTPADLKDFKYEVLDDGTAEITDYSGQVPRLEIPGTIDGYTITRISSIAFINCPYMITVTIPDSVTSIGTKAFYKCNKLIKVTLPDSIISIEADAFCCNTLACITIGKDIKSIGEYALGYYYDMDADSEHAKIKNFTISGYSGTEAEKYANENGFEFISLGEAPTEDTATTEPTEGTTATEPSVTEPSATEPSATEPSETTPTPAKTTVTVKNAPKTLYVKGKAQINADVKNGKGTTTYKSSNTKVAKVSAKGKITALKKGTATITVTNNGVSKSFKISVKNPKLNKTKKTLKKGEKFQLTVTGKVGKQTYTSNNKKVATVSKNGKITAKKKGNATITVKTNGMKLKCTIKVK